MKTGGRDIAVKTGRLPVKPGGLAGMLHYLSVAPPYVGAKRTIFFRANDTAEIAGNDTFQAFLLGPQLSF